MTTNLKYCSRVIYAAGSQKSKESIAGHKICKLKRELACMKLSLKVPLSLDFDTKQ